MRFSPLLDELIESLRCLPGVGPKTAQRMALTLLTRNRSQGRALANCLINAMEHVKHCKMCRIFSEIELCYICASAHRDSTQLCIVENPIDVIALEQTNSYRGKYFVLLGRLSPLDGMTPEAIGINQLKTILETTPIAEMIIATNPTIEGEATAHYIATLAKEQAIRVTRIACGVPIGSELEYVDPNTLSYAFEGRN
ncbi:MAG: recombination protein RecR [Gammaproteobacteria bacterium RIFCSPHIGHO2_12_FULL_42_10]|nr:MAG: recombination protein RecR [Gammaproteobacteria bacterium RIFCSPHIGHO2_12_FULL_42_10]